jgi:hypothetical protein
MVVPPNWKFVTKDLAEQLGLPHLNGMRVTFRHKESAKRFLGEGGIYFVDARILAGSNSGVKCF